VIKAIGFLERTSATERFTAGYGLAVAAAVGGARGFPAGLGTLLVNLAAAGIGLCVLSGMRHQPARVMRFLGHTSPLLVFYLFYRECGLILSLPGVHWRDASLLEAETALRRVFPDVPTGAGEAAAAAYMSYIPFVVVAAILVFRGEAGARGLEALVRRICFAWAACFAAFVLFPVLGPRFVDATGQAALFGTGPFSALALFNQLTAIIALAALSPRQRLVLLPVALSIFVSVIALRYHYRVDVVAGIVVGLGAIAIDRGFVTLNAAARNPPSRSPKQRAAKRVDSIAYSSTMPVYSAATSAALERDDT